MRHKKFHRCRNDMHCTRLYACMSHVEFIKLLLRAVFCISLFVHAASSVAHVTLTLAVCACLYHSKGYDQGIRQRSSW